jgi:hypothetical protein
MPRRADTATGQCSKLDAAQALATAYAARKRHLIATLQSLSGCPGAGEDAVEAALAAGRAAAEEVRAEERERRAREAARHRAF